MGISCPFVWLASFRAKTCLLDGFLEVFVFTKKFCEKYQFPFNFVLYKIRITSDLEKGTNYILNATVGDLCLSLNACVRARMSELA